MSTVERAKYILVVSGRVIESGDDARVLIGQFALRNSKTPAMVKPWREHVWVDGVPGSIFNKEHCEACKRIRPNESILGNLVDDPCRSPENVDEDIELISFHPPHAADRCCVEHGHHVLPQYPHVNCFLR